MTTYSFFYTEYSHNKEVFPDNPHVSCKDRTRLMSVYLLSTLHGNGFFGSARYGLIYAKTRHGRYSRVRNHCTLHCCKLILCS